MLSVLADLLRTLFAYLPLSPGLLHPRSQMGPGYPGGYGWGGGSLAILIELLAFIGLLTLCALAFYLGYILSR